MQPGKAASETVEQGRRSGMNARLERIAKLVQKQVGSGRGQPLGPVVLLRLFRIWSAGRRMNFGSEVKLDPLP
ncbi:hypothetical protein ERJ75_001269400 [Trypanosoma vivax]|nr:hypothetical protein ERJ75_001269400 [Trypanosoma vivax]